LVQFYFKNNKKLRVKILMEREKYKKVKYMKKKKKSYMKLKKSKKLI